MGKPRKPEGPRDPRGQASDRQQCERKRHGSVRACIPCAPGFEQATEIIESNEGKVTKTETWGLKNLAYKIDRNRKAHFVLLNIEGPGAMVAELERQTRINEDVIRYMTIRVDEHEEGPSAMMRKNERDSKKRRERSDRGDN